MDRNNQQGPKTEICALLFDVFGTVVDWRSTIENEGLEWQKRYGIETDWSQFADRWRQLYQPAMSDVRDKRRPWTILDQLHRENLDKLLVEYKMDHLDEDARQWINLVWHRLTPWPDSVSGLERLKTRYIIAAHSNGNIALIVSMAKNARLPWDMVLGAEVTGHYKPQPQSYLIAAQKLGLQPQQCMMVAAHNSDLEAARNLNLHTAFVVRPTEHGEKQTSDLRAEQNWDFIAGDLDDLASQLEC